MMMNLSLPHIASALAVYTRLLRQYGPIELIGYVEIVDQGA
ncbi:hypothetical protein [Verminephrobacter aporrectodeae]|nr:hypothetical protein [Verminephrobacter aporrectodeae]